MLRGRKSGCPLLHEQHKLKKELTFSFKKLTKPTSDGVDVELTQLTKN